MPNNASPNSLNPAALALADAARLLAKVGGTGVTEANVRDDVAAGAPTNTDGTINLVHYAAWVCLMLRNESRRNSDAETP
jgi:hypothetical protein